MSAVPDPGTLPRLGLGLSSNLSVRARPHPYRLWDAHPESFDYVEYSAPLSIAEARRSASLFEEMWQRRARLPVLLHPVHLNLYGPELESDAALEALGHHASEVGAPWVSNDLAWWHARGHFLPGYLYVPPPFTPAGIADCAAHVAHVQARLPVPLAIENPAVIARRGSMHVLAFMAAVAERTGAELLLDLGHLLSHQLAHGLPLDAELERFPLERVIEIHIAGGAATRRGGRRLYVDDHAQPVREELFALLEQIVPACSRLRALTYEGDGHTEAVALADLQRLRRSMPPPARPDAGAMRRPTARAGAAPQPRRPGPTRISAPESAAAALDSQPWRVFDACYGRDAAGLHAGDPAGAEAERALRLLAVAERIDRVFPLTRLLLAADAEGLTAFAASDEFRDGFRAPGRDTPESFARFARRRVRESADEELAKLLAFESWALERLHERAPTLGALAPAAREAPLERPAREAGAERFARQREVLARFPLDLSDVLAAAAEIRRRAAERQAGFGGLTSDEPAATETPAARLRALLREAPPRRWTVAIARREGRIAVRSAASDPTPQARPTP